MPETKLILLAEDRQDDVEIILKAFERACIVTPVYVVRDGEEAIQYLKGEGAYSNRAEYPLPALFLLDLKMPRVDGFEVLKWVRAQPGLSALPVVVLTSSDAIRDVNRAYELGANSFLVKQMEFEDAIALGHMIYSYWVKTSAQPTTTRSERRATSRDNLPPAKPAGR